MRLSNRRSYYDVDYAARVWWQTLRWGLVIGLLAELWRRVVG